MKIKDRKKRKEISGEIEIPNGIEIKLGKTLDVKGPKGEIKKNLYVPSIAIKQEGNKIMLMANRHTKKEKKLLCSIRAHIKNMIAGVTTPYVYKLQICSVHFPMTASVDKGRGLLVIKNFLGEVKERTARLLPDVDVKIDKDMIIIESCDIEKAGQTAANIENATRVRQRDRRVFQDGIYMINKAGEEI